MTSFLSKIFSFLRHSWPAVLFFSIVWGILLVNSVHNSYPDEFDNILGGWLALKGTLPYSGYFAHHMPLGYLLAAIIEILSGQSFVRFRILTSVFYLIILWFSMLFLRKQLGESRSNFFYGYIIVLVIASTYFWGHMFLADCLSAYFIIPAFGLLFLKLFHGERLTKKDLVIISFFSAAALLTSTTYMFAVAIVVGISAWSYIPKVKIFSKSTIRLIVEAGLIFALPYFIFSIYLVVTGSFRDFYFDNIIYNQKYYIYNYPGKASNGINPIRYAISILNNFINNYQVLLARVTSTDFRYPYNVALAVGNTSLWIYLILKKKYLAAVASFAVLAMATVRNNPADSRATDYQSAVYFFLSFFNMTFGLSTMAEEIRSGKDALVRNVSMALMLLVGFFWFFNMFFVGAELWRMTYSRYMGEMPLIYDRPQIAPIVNGIVPKDHYCWVGPFEFEENFYLNCKLPSKYTWILPQFANSQELMKNILAEYSERKADVIVYNRNYSAFFQGPQYNKFFIDLLEDKYMRLRDIPGFEKYKFRNSPTQNFNFEDDFNFRKDIATKLAKALLDQGRLELK